MVQAGPGYGALHPAAGAAQGRGRGKGGGQGGGLPRARVLVAAALCLSGLAMLLAFQVGRAPARG